MDKMIKICQFSSVHPHNDTRVFIRECCGLARIGYDVTLVIEGNSSTLNGVKIIGAGEKPNSRIKRMINFAPKVYSLVLKNDADIYHFHDPELLPFALKLKKKGKKVIYDMHEDIPAVMYDKKWIPVALRKPISLLYKNYESRKLRKLDALIVVTKHLETKYKDLSKKTIVINNYASLHDIRISDKPFSERERVISYAGNMQPLYGQTVLFEAMHSVNGILKIAGNFNQKVDEDNILVIGKLNREQVNDLYGEARVGVVLYQYAGNNVDSQPAKLFEYMAAGIPVVTSNFPLWRELVEKNNCGICVDQTNPKEIAKAINYLLDNPEIGQEMGLNGRNAVLSKYNWEHELAKLDDLYKAMIIR